MGMAGDRSRNGNGATVHPLAAAIVAEPDGTGPMTGEGDGRASSVRCARLVEYTSFRRGRAALQVGAIRCIGETSKVEWTRAPLGHAAQCLA